MQVTDKVDAARVVLHAGVVETLSRRQVPAHSRLDGLGIGGPFRDGGLLGLGPVRVHYLEIARNAVGRSDFHEMPPWGGRLNSAVDGP